MNCLFVFALAIPLALAIDINFSQWYGTGIRGINIPSCNSEPCALVKGTPLNLTITVETVYPPEDIYPTVSDLESTIDISGYRNRYIYSLAETQSFCKTQEKDCPLELNHIYNIDRQIFLSKDNKTTNISGFGSRNGPTQIQLMVSMIAHENIGANIGSVNLILDIKPGQ